MRNNLTYKDIWANSYPILIWLMTEPLAGLVDSRIAGIIGLDTLSSVGIGTTIYFVFTWIFIFLAYGTTPLVAKLKTNTRGQSEFLYSQNQLQKWHNF